MVKLLASNSALGNHLGDEGAIQKIVLFKCPEHLEAMLAAGMLPDEPIPCPGETLLQHAASRGDMALLRALVAHGVDLEGRNVHGETALGYAAAWEQPEAVRFLLANGALVNAVEGTVPGELDTALDATFKISPSPIDLKIRALLRSHGAKRFRELDQGPSQNL
jgi:hypothetical protein